MQTMERERRGPTAPSEAARRRAAPAVRRHRVYVGLAVLALLVILVAVPIRSGPPAPHRAAPASVIVPAGVTPPTPAYGTGQTVGGVACGPGVRQVPWSAYAPPCQPAWHGDNGGATSSGVTAHAIRVTVRLAAASNLSALSRVAPGGPFGPSASELATLDAYVAAFNRQFELYGRRVVLVPYQGRNDFVAEDLGAGAVLTEEDAATAARTLHAFADVSLVDSSLPYDAALADDGVVSLGLPALPATDYAAAAPWEYTAGPDCTKAAEATGAVLGRQLAGGPAALAGDPGLRRTVRRFGIVSVALPAGAACARQTLAQLARHHVGVAESATLPFALSASDSGQSAAEAQAAVAQMKAGGVTSVICSPCDPLAPLVLMAAADRLDYHPEWWVEPALAGAQTDTDALTRILPPDQADHLISFGTAPLPYASQEAVRAFRAGEPDPGARPAASFAATYMTLLELFDALQLAGPDLTPRNLAVAMGRLPRSLPGGMLGGWDGAAGPADPAATYSVLKWFAARPSPVDGRPGTWVACDAGRLFPYAGPGPRVPAHATLVCTPADAAGSSGHGGPATGGPR